MNIKIQSPKVKNPIFIKNATEEYIKNLRLLLPDVDITQISDEEFDSFDESSHPPKGLKLTLDTPSGPKLTGN